MTEWQVVGVIIALAGFVGGIVAALYRALTARADKNSQTMKENTEALTRLAVGVENLGKDFDKFTDTNREAHKELYTKLENHETRITVLEEVNK